MSTCRDCGKERDCYTIRQWQHSEDGLCEDYAGGGGICLYCWTDWHDHETDSQEIYMHDGDPRSLWEAEWKKQNAETR